MSKQTIPLIADDISQFSRALTKQILQNEQPLSHVRMLNLLAKANGFRNFQHMRASHKSAQRINEPTPSEAIDFSLVQKCLRQFDAEGILMRWPSRSKTQKTILWVFWALLPKAEILSEKSVNEILCSRHGFEDPATLRRLMIGYGMLTRNRDGSEYQRIEQKPPAEAIELIKRVGAGRGR